MTDTPWSNRQQQMVQEYLDALLTDPEAVAEQPEAVAEPEVVQPAAAKAEQPASVAIAETDVSDALSEAEELIPETSVTASMSDDNIPDGSDAEADSVAEIQLPEYEAEDAVSAESVDQAEEPQADEAQAVPAESVSEIQPESEEALDAALHAIESVKAAEEAEEATAEFDEPVADVNSEQPAAEEFVAELPEDLAADDGISTIDDPISVAAELLHEELDQYDADPFEDTEASEPVSVLQDIPEIASEPEALLPVEESAADAGAEAGCRYQPIWMPMLKILPICSQ